LMSISVPSAGRPVWLAGTIEIAHTMPEMPSQAEAPNKPR
jgi:hypothetical protein